MTRVAVITGAGSGIGRALSLACARRGMAVVAADIEATALQQTLALLQALGAPCTGEVCDVGSEKQVQALADLSWSTYGRVDWLFNNAGVAVLGPVWEATTDDWSWVMGVNLMGVAHGVRAFVPRMLEAGAPAHVINTASAAGLATLAGSGVYCASKHAVVAMSECLQHDLRAVHAPIGVSVICPSLLPSRIDDSARNRPPQWAQAAATAPAYYERVRRGMEASTVTADDVAAMTLKAIERGGFYITPHDQTWTSVERRMRAIGEDHQHGRSGEDQHVER
ncbi:MAG: SDR family NAD(P)-dependent oxidoreductase [Hyphomicrobiales bacterium]|nr:SDR family NAD(P)-dependent oxidoreductase [Hyphomicrobiales bacterium]